MIFPDSSLAFEDAYPDKPALLRHGLIDNPLFDIDRIAALAKTLPPQSIEYNRADLSVGHDPAAMPFNGLSPEETIRRIHDCASWIVLIKIEQDPDYRALMLRCLEALRPEIENKTGPIHGLASFLFVSSPRAVTPFHMDPEYNILMQIRGAKTFTLFPANDFSMIPPEAHEAYHALGRRDIGYREEFAAFARPFRLTPGDALYSPLKAPHHIEAEGGLSISYSITWRSRLSDADAHLHRMNHALRRRGLRPPAPGVAPGRDAAKIFAHKLYSRIRRPRRPSERGWRISNGRPCGGSREAL